MNAHPTKQLATPTTDPSGGHTLDPGHDCPDIQKWSAGVEPSADSDQGGLDTHRTLVAVGSSSNQPPTSGFATPIPTTSGGWLELRIWAEMFNDAQQQRIATVNRAERGGVDPINYADYTEALQQAEHICGLHMKRCYRRVVPSAILQWQKNTSGIGEHALARLLGHLGHPLWATPHHWEGTGSSRVLITDPPFERTVGQLWQYCGHGRPGRKHKGMSADELAAMGSPSLKMLVHLISKHCMKARSSPFRLVYDDARLTYADRSHSVECVRCGPSGKPAQPGTPWSLGHQHAAALRKVSKEVLRDLWKVSA